MWQDGKVLLTRFCGEKELNHLVADLEDLYMVILQDKDVSNFFASFRSLLWRGMEKPSITRDTDYINEWKAVYGTAKKWISDPRYYKIASAALRDSLTLLGNLREDPLLQDLANKSTALAMDFVDPTATLGGVVTKEALLQLKALLFPIIRKHLFRIPLPKMEGKEDNFEYRLEKVNYCHSNYSISFFFFGCSQSR